MKSKKVVTVFGAGSWGTAIAKVLAENQYHVNLWIREEKVFTSIKKTRKNKLFLPGIELPKRINPIISLEDKRLFDTNYLVFSLPAQYTRNFLMQIKNNIKRGVLIINTSKGIEENSMKTIYEVFNDSVPYTKSRYVTISGPSFAKDVANRLPTAISMASYNPDSLIKAKNLFHNKYFAVYPSNDVVGLEIGGSMKNIIAIGAGIFDGLEFSESSKATFITRGLNEIRILAELMGAKKTTFLGLAGIGDLVLTAYGNKSRNRNLGFMLGKGKKLKKIINSGPTIAEGYFTTKAVYRLIKKFRIRLPILETIYAILYKSKNPKILLEILTRKDTTIDI